MVDKVDSPVCDLINASGARDEWRGDRRYLECGNCLVDYTGGICPLTVCAQDPMHGPCGGAEDNRCEYKPNARGCGWECICRRLDVLGSLDRVSIPLPPKGQNKVRTPGNLTSAMVWALERRNREASA